MKERWKPVVGYEGLYEVSDMGRIRSMKRVDSSGHHREGRLRKLGSTPHGYVVIALCKNGVYQHCSVHGLVLEAFVGPRPEGKCVAHGNGVKTDNRRTNLRWATYPENYIDRIAHGTTILGDDHWTRKHPERVKRGEEASNARFTLNDVKRMHRMRAQGKLLKEIGLEFATHYKYISRILVGKHWSGAKCAS